MTRWGYDDTNAIIVGGDSPQIGWKLFYNGRPQQSFNKHYSNTELEAEKEGRELIESLKSEFEGICYNEEGGEWEIRIDQFKKL